MLINSKKLKKSDSNDSVLLYGSDLDAATQRYMDAIDHVQEDLSNINKKANDEILLIEQKYSLLRKPYYEKRSEYIENIPNFWITAIMNHPDLGSIVNDKEEECLNHLTKFEIIEATDLISGFKINFYFSDNPFFENQSLTKEYQLGKNPKIISTTIKWKNGQSLVKETDNNVEEKSNLESKSFFNWLTDISDPADDIAEIFKDDLWKNPMYYYLVPDHEDVANVEGDDSDASEMEEINENINTDSNCDEQNK